MSNLQNPFLVYGYNGPETFCGRKVETRNLIDALRNGRNITLRSPRRVGKTGLILNAFHQIQEETPDVACFYIDIYSTHTLHDFVAEFGKAIVGMLDTPLQKVQNYAAQFFKSCRLILTPDPLTGAPSLSLDIVPSAEGNTLEEIFAYLKQSDRECIIAIDEFQQIAEYPEGGIEGMLRKYVQFCPNVHFIFSGSKQHLMAQIFNSPKRPFYRSTEKMTLDVLPEDEYYAFVQEKMNGIGTQISKDVFHRIYNMVDGITWYVQYILNKIYERHLNEVTDQDITDCIEQILLQEQDDYKKEFSLLTLNQSQVLSAIAHQHCIKEITGKSFLRQYHLPGGSSVLRAIDYLIDKEYIYLTDNGYIIYDRFMALWLLRK